MINWRRVAWISIIAFLLFNQGRCDPIEACNPLILETCE